MDKVRVKESLNKAVDLLEMLESLLFSYTRGDKNSSEAQSGNQTSLPLKGVGLTLSECKSELKNVLSEVELTFASDDSEGVKKENLSLGTVEELSEALSSLASEIETSGETRGSEEPLSLSESSGVNGKRKKSISDRIRSMPRVRVF